MQSVKRLVPAASLCAVLLAQVAPANAAVTVYTDRASFLAALPASALVATDEYDDLAAGEQLPGPLMRGAGVTAYQVAVQDTLGLGSADGAQDFFPVSPTGSGTALSANFAANTLVFDHFAPGARALAGNFFSTGESGAFLPGQALTLTFTAGDGASTLTLNPAGVASFVGFTSDAPLLSLQVSAVQAGQYNWAAVDNLTVSAVPEPAMPLMLGLGLGVLGFAVRRKR